MILAVLSNKLFSLRFIPCPYASLLCIMELDSQFLPNSLWLSSASGGKLKSRKLGEASFLTYHVKIFFFFFMSSILSSATYSFLIEPLKVSILSRQYWPPDSINTIISFDLSNPGVMGSSYSCS